LKSSLTDLKCELYQSGGFSVLLDTQTVSVVNDGEDGEPSYNVVLTNSNHTFPAGTSSAIGGNTSIGVLGYKGATQIDTYIGTITGSNSDYPSKISAQVSNNDTTSTTITVTASSTLSQDGTLTIPVTLDGSHTFNMTFSYSLAFQGTPGTAGESGKNVATVYLYKRADSAADAGLPTGTLTYHFNDGTLTGTDASYFND